MRFGPRFFLCVFASIAALSLARGVFAQNQSSPSFQNTNPSLVPAFMEAQSSSYQVSGSIGAFVGQIQSATYISETGPPGNPGTVETPAPTPGSSGGSGPGGSPGGDYIPFPSSSTQYLLPLPSLNGRIWTYKALTRVFGERGTELAEIFVNGSPFGVNYPSSLTWERNVPLGLGNNLIYAQARKDDRISQVISLVTRRRLIGDVNDSQRVDDVDLSLFSRHWSAYNPASDFNEDGQIDDVDLSLLASHWNQYF